MVAWLASITGVVLTPSPLGGAQRGPQRMEQPSDGVAQAALDCFVGCASSQ
jgi:hypothetical protein